MNSERSTRLGRFATENALAISFVAAVLCLVGMYAAWNTPSSVFPQTNFPRIVILVNNGIMPADEMMAGVTRPIEEAMKDIPGTITIRSATTRGSAQINVFFNWHVDMVQSELYALGRLSEIRSDLPASAVTTVSRVTFSAFPIIGISLTSPTRDLMSLWNTAEYDLKPRFLQIPGVARVELVGGQEPEYHVIVNPVKLDAARLSLADVTDALAKNNLVAPAGMLEEDYHLYLATVDGRVHSIPEIEDVVITARRGHPVLIKDVATVERGPKPVFTVVTAQGRNAVLLNIESQPQGSTLDIANALQAQLKDLRRVLPPDLQLGFFYNQSQFVRESVGSVRDAIVFGLILSLLILYFFLKNWGSVFTAILTIPITVLITSVSLRLLNMSFNMMTLGGIAAAIGLIIDDAIVVVEAIHSKITAGRLRLDGIHEGVGEILHPLIASTLTPVVVFIPLAFLTGVTGVFFRALALTMVVSLITSLALAVTLTPSLAGWFIREPKKTNGPKKANGFLFPRVLRVYEWSVRRALRHEWLTLAACVLIAILGVVIYRNLKTDFLPNFDEGGFVIDYNAPPGTSLTETSRILDQAEAIIRADADVEGYSRRLGTQLGLFITEPYSGDFLVKLKPDRKHSTDEVIARFRHEFNQKFPMVRWDFPGILTDLIGDLQMEPDPIGIKIFSPDLDWLKKTAPRLENEIKSVPGVVDTFNGLTETGPSVIVRVRPADAERFGFSTADIGDAAHTAMLGQTSSHVLEGDRMVDIRVMEDPKAFNSTAALRELPLRAPAGGLVKLSQVADVKLEPSQVELDREDLRQDVVVTGRLEGRDLGSAMKEIQAKLAGDKSLPPGTIQYGGLYQQQQESFRNLLFVLLMALLLVFTVLVIEFGSFYEPIAIVFGALLGLFGTVTALWLTGTTLNIVSFLGAIIGVGVVAKNGILMLDQVGHWLSEGLSLEDALVRSGDRRLRPVLMTSLAAALGMLPLALGIGSGADILRPLAIAMIGALCISVLLSLVATPTLYFLMRKAGRKKPPPAEPAV
ncbi:MAG TPA: efflux RND transporter permease subunit [Candidatus Saccharimonadales bacterium]|nr:efflux RND transporter permease subunit [Candidatus Saccharimonadales bacterium]